jgi:hypothetical protein
VLKVAFGDLMLLYLFDLRLDWLSFSFVLVQSYEVSNFIFLINLTFMYETFIATLIFVIMFFSIF